MILIESKEDSKSSSLSIDYIDKSYRCIGYLNATYILVYLDASISDENRNAILQIAKEKNYKVKQMVVDRGAYALHAEDVG